MLAWIAAVLALFVSAGCGIERAGLAVDAGSDVVQPGQDAGTDAMASMPDASRDAGSDAAFDASVDADTPDAGEPDAGEPDAGSVDGGPPDCRSTPRTCDAPGLGAQCSGEGSCWPGLTCCETSHCGSGGPMGGMCTVSCASDDDCPLDMQCEHNVCWFPCVGGVCPAPDMLCQHGGTVCEWG